MKRGIISLQICLLVAGCDASSLGPDTTDRSSLYEVVVSPVIAEIPVGGTQQFTATFLTIEGDRLDQPATWSSRNSAVATISLSGLVTGVAPGIATITATRSSATKTNLATVTVAGGGDAGDRRILIDASHGGGVWWFPQVSPFVAEEDHQGRAFAEYLRSRGYVVDELPRGTLISDSQLASYKYVIRVGDFTEYRSSELAAYERFVERDATLILLSGHQATSPGDGLAEALGVTFTGDLTGVLTRYAAHPITAGVGSGTTYQNGAIATAFNSDEVEIIAWVNDTVPVMGVIRSHEAKIFFSGTAFPFLNVSQPLVDNLIRWGFDLP